MPRRPAKRPGWRAVHGILLLDKPGGVSSNHALQSARRLLRAEKAGHTGSLDPLATGLLPLCFGEATKVAGFLLGSSKAYQTTARLGIRTDTDDADGAELERRPCIDIDLARIDAALQPLRGRILQRPPAYSALKREGVPAYRRARAGEQVELEPRWVEVKRIDVLGLEGDLLRLEIECGSGTYVRSLVRDLGEALGCGAHVLELRRLWVDPFVAPIMLSLTQLEAMDEAERTAALLPLEAGLAHMPELQLDAEQAQRLRLGQRLPSACSEGEFIAWHQGAALGRVSVDASGLIKPERIFIDHSGDGAV